MTRRSLIRALVALVTMMVACLATSRASAMAPMCDPRGAAVFAPPPQIQDPELSLDIPPDCAEDSPLDVRNAVPGHGPLQLDTSTPDMALTGSLGFATLTFSERQPFVVFLAARPPPAPKSTLERPPRT